MIPRYEQRWWWKVCGMRVTTAISGIKEKVKSCQPILGKLYCQGTFRDIVIFETAIPYVYIYRYIPSCDKVKFETRIFLSTRYYYRKKRIEHIFKISKLYKFYFEKEKIVIEFTIR